MFISVIICTYKRYELLRLAIESLAAQTAGRERFEVLIIENDKTESAEIKKLVTDYSTQLDIRSITETEIGLSNARNRGIREARGDYLWFLDDDAKANPCYIENLLEIITKIKPDACGGPYYPYYLTPKPKWFKDEYGSQIYERCPRFLTENETLMGGNMIFRTSFFTEYGGFNVKYGMAGNKIYYGEETYLQLKARKSNKDLLFYYDNKLDILHFVLPNKMTLWDRTKRAYNLGHSHVFWDETKSGKFMLLRNFVVTCAKIAFDFSFKILFRDKNKYKYWQNYYYEVTAVRFGTLGNLTYKIANKNG